MLLMLKSRKKAAYLYCLVRYPCLLYTSMDGYNILLFHRADLLDCFNDANYDLILSGHLHGGQINIPFIGGLISPDMVWMPDYDVYKRQTWYSK